MAPVSASGIRVSDVAARGMGRRRLRGVGGFCGALLACLLLVLVVLPVSGARGADTLDLEKAVKIGSGPTTVIEFTDPDCPYCRKAEAWFATRHGVTRYVFFLPLASHPDSKGKIQYILSAKDKARAYLEVVSGNFDAKKLSAITPEGIRLQQEHKEIAYANDIHATPIFMIYGRIIRGFDPQRLAAAMK